MDDWILAFDAHAAYQVGGGQVQFNDTAYEGDLEVTMVILGRLIGCRAMSTTLIIIHSRVLAYLVVLIRASGCCSHYVAGADGSVEQP